MVQQDNPNPNVIGTRLQTIVTAQGERINRLSSQFDELSASMVSMRELIESMFVTIQKQEGKQILVGSEGSPSGIILNDNSGSSSLKNTSGSGQPPPRAFPPTPPDDTVFSLPRVQLPLFDSVDPQRLDYQGRLILPRSPHHSRTSITSCTDVYGQNRLALVL